MPRVYIGEAHRVNFFYVSGEGGAIAVADPHFVPVIEIWITLLIIAHDSGELGLLVHRERGSEVGVLPSQTA